MTGDWFEIRSGWGHRLYREPGRVYIYEFGKGPYSLAGGNVLTRSQWMGWCPIDCEDCAAQREAVGMTVERFESERQLSANIRATTFVPERHIYVNSATGYLWADATLRLIDARTRPMVPSPVGMEMDKGEEDGSAKNEQPDAPVTGAPNSQNGEREGDGPRPWWRRLWGRGGGEPGDGDSQ